jgi:hypothetical protein
MIGHHGISIHRHRKALGQLHDAILDPLPAVLEVFACEVVFTKKKSAPDTPGHDMVVTGLVFGNDGCAGRS